MTDEREPPSSERFSEPPPSTEERDAAFARLLKEVARTPHYEPVQEGVLVGEYRVVRPLGRGSFGTVYEAVHTIIDKQAALKVLNPEVSRDPQVVQRFIDEARAVNRIAHPNIVDIFGFGALPDGRKYCVMALLQGATLAALVKQRGRLPAAEALPILAEVANALDAAHAAGVVHRDLKPENVFLSQASGGARKVTLLDFGIARMAGDERRVRTGTGVVLGTPAYMSPEQCAGSSVDHRTDLYAFGVVAFEVLTGRTPFVGEKRGHLFTQHLTSPPPRASDLAPDLAPELDAVFGRLLAKRPEERPGSAAEALQLLTAGLGAAAPARRAKTPGVWLVLVLLMLVLVAAWFAR
jgi:eukaryotic-like serine/threonine-protein kinase